MPIVPEEELISKKSKLAMNVRSEPYGYQTSVLEYRQPNKHWRKIKHEVERQAY